MTDNNDDPIEPPVTEAEVIDTEEANSNSEEESSRLKEFLDRHDGSRVRRFGDASSGLLMTVLNGWLVFMTAFAFKFLSLMPKSGALGDKLIDAGYKVKLKTTKADTIVNVIYGDGMVVPRAAEWRTTENEYRLGDGKAYKTDKLGSPRLVNGKYPTVWALAESAEVMDPIAAFAGGQRRRGNYEQHLRTDGGGTDVAIHGEAPDGYDGWALSFRDAYRLFGSNVSQEDMSLQATRAKLAELDWSRKEQVILLLAFAGGAALGLFGPALAQSIAGAGGSGGGTGITLPLFLAGVPF